MSQEQLGKDIRFLMRGCDRASLALTLSPDQDQDQSAYVALVLTAFDMDSCPLLFISNLAEHTKALRHNPACSLLLDATYGLRDPLTGARATLQGSIEFLTDAEANLAKERFIRRHPSAEIYRHFGDFNMVRLKPTRAHLVAGFGKIHWVDWSDIHLKADTDALSSAENDVITHMNEDHADVINLIANKLLNQTQVGWHLTGLDPDGCDLHLDGQSLRYSFNTQVLSADEARKEFVTAAKLARSS